jgi:hypothetical protein
MKNYLLGLATCAGLSFFFWMLTVQFLRDADAWVK